MESSSTGTITQKEISSCKNIKIGATRESYIYSTPRQSQRKWSCPLAEFGFLTILLQWYSLGRARTSHKTSNLGNRGFCTNLAACLVDLSLKYLAKHTFWKDFDRFFLYIFHSNITQNGWRQRGASSETHPDGSSGSPWSCDQQYHEWYEHHFDAQWDRTRKDP